MADPFKLTPDEQRTLRDMNPDLVAARETAQKLAAMGIDVSAQLERIQKASDIRAGFLRDFSNPLSNR